MKKELDEKLCADYPKIFVNRYGDPDKTCMNWGFECDDGWYTLIDALCKNIQHHITQQQEARQWAIDYNQMLIDVQRRNDWTSFYIRYDGMGEQYVEQCKARVPTEPLRDVAPEIDQVVAVQVKEKFGGLRFYYEGGDETIYGMVRMAESMSVRTCEVCGNLGKPRNTGWIRTLCDVHAELQGANDE